MLELKKIKKDYLAGENTVHALKGIDLAFRSAEFVSILGPSGCGKTTMLNIIGGLDKYSSGDLFINGRSTKDYKDRDWDTYRNHSIGFVFQSYNLIPHQSVLQNVELALTLSGVKKAERHARAKQALIDVGLDGQFKKRPSEMSGGQMQRVAIARALVNNPDIILADEPTGALDTETSVQVMDILKEISKNKLVIMVTHNPELAAKYSTRIINMLDGEITGDSNPLTQNDMAAEKVIAQKRLEEESKMKKPSMSIFTSFGLSLKNLFTKKGRTLLTSFAGSIGIIGIALILAVSQGTTAFINGVQESTLSAYPLTLEASTIELSSLIQAFMNVSQNDNSHENDAIYEKAALTGIINALTSIQETKNDLNAFKKYLENEVKNNSKLNNALNGIQYSYDLDMHIYTKNVDGKIIRSDVEKLLTQLIYGTSDIPESPQGNSPSGNMMSMGGMSMGSALWQEILPGKDGSLVNPLLYDQYEVIHGEWPKEYNEVVLVVDKNNELGDITLYALGLLPEENIIALKNAALTQTPIENPNLLSWSYEDICNSEYKIILNSDLYSYNELTGLYTDKSNDSMYIQTLYNNATPLKVSGIIRPSENSETHMLSGSICYTSALTEYVIKNSQNTGIINAQLNSPDIDVISGLAFDTTNGSRTDPEKAQMFIEYVSQLDTAKKSELYITLKSIPTDEYFQTKVAELTAGKTKDELIAMILSSLNSNPDAQASVTQEQLEGLDEATLTGFIFDMLKPQLTLEYEQTIKNKYSSYTNEEKAGLLDSELAQATQDILVSYFDLVIKFSNSSYENNLKKFGFIDLDTPSKINLFASSFENKDIIVSAIDEYNKMYDSPENQAKQIAYTDYFGLIMSSVTTIIDAITYVLIAFVSISLIVSSIMIGVITLISVQERTKEIGILRAIGASKKNVSGMFNAETIIVGFSSGLLGVVVTYLLCIPINLILNHLTGIATLKAVLPINAAIILVIISVCLTLISGFIPSRSAAKKDPVVALRTE